MTAPKRGRPRNPLGAGERSPVLYLRQDAELEAAVIVLASAFAHLGRPRVALKSVLINCAKGMDPDRYESILKQVQKRRRSSG